MKDGVVLEDGYIVYLSTISSDQIYNISSTDVFFNNSGRVARFKTNELPNTEYYIAIYNTNTGDFNGYYPEFSFWKNSYPRNDIYVSNESMLSMASSYFRTFQLIPGLFNHQASIVEGTRVILVNKFATTFTENNQLKIKIDFKIRSFTFTSDLNDYPAGTAIFFNRIYINNEPISYYTIDNFPGILETELTYAVLDTVLADYFYGIVSKEFKNSDGSTSFTLDDEHLVLEVIFLFYQLLYENIDLKNYLTQNNLIEVFEKHFENCSSLSEISISDFHENYTRRYFSLLRLKLLEFKSWVQGIAFKPASFYNQEFLLPSDTDFVVRIVSLFTHFDLSTLLYNNKIDLLNRMLKNNFYLSGRWWPFYSDQKLTEEEVVVKIVRSIAYENSQGTINYIEINMFLDYLSSTYVGNKNRTLYQILYEKINDDILFGNDGKGNRGQFIKALYLLWENSKYNPNSIENINEAYEFQYTSYNAQWKFDDPNESSPDFDQTASPNLINYESEKILLWYVDNYKFAFGENKIVAIEETEKSFSEKMLALFINSLSPIKINPSYKYAPYGFYHIFQPVSIKNTNNLDTIIQIPISGNLNDPCDVTESKNGNSVPIFYLKYLDDVGDYSDFKETVGVTLDVVLTFSGIGNIAKARHLTKASVVRRYLTGGAVTVLERELIIRSFRGISFASWEIILGTASTLYNITTNSCQNFNDPCNPPQPGTPQYEQFQSCLAIQKWLFALEIITMSGDLLAKRYMRRASRDIQPHLPDNFPTAQRQFIDGMADMEGALTDFLNGLQSSNPNVYNKINNLPTQEKKFAFMFDFENKPYILKQLDNDPNLVDAWNEYGRLYNLRKEPRYLRSYYRFMQNPKEVEHITKVKNKSTPPNFTPGAGHTYENIINGNILNPNTPGLPSDLQSIIIDELNGHINYDVLWFKYPSGTTIPSTSTNNIKEFPIDSGNWYKKKKNVSRNTMWNPDWDDQRVKEEFSFLWANKEIKSLQRNTDQVINNTQQNVTSFRSRLTDGTEVEFEVNNIYNQFNETFPYGISYLKLILKK